jgi:hypothetical protein
VPIGLISVMPQACRTRTLYRCIRPGMWSPILPMARRFSMIGLSLAC